MVVYMDLTMHGQFVVMFFHVRIDNKFCLIIIIYGNPADG